MEENKEIIELVKEFIYLLDTKEISDNGRLFSPNQISSCRVMDGKRMNEILIRLKELTE